MLKTEPDVINSSTYSQEINQQNHHHFQVPGFRLLARITSINLEYQVTNYPSILQHPLAFNEISKSHKKWLDIVQKDLSHFRL